MKKLLLVLIALAAWSASAEFFVVQSQIGTEARFRCTDTSAVIQLVSQSATTLAMACAKKPPTASPLPSPKPSPVISPTPAPTGGLVYTTVPSYPGAPLKGWPDKLTAATKSPLETFDWAKIKPENRLYMYSVVTSQTTLDRHYPSQWGRQDESVLPYVAAAQRFGIIPMFFSAAYNVDGAKFMAVNTTGDLVYPVRMYDAGTITPAALQAFAAHHATTGRKAVIYLCDEPSTHDALPGCLSAVRAVRQYFPAAEILVTDVFRQDLYDAGVRRFSPPLNYVTLSAAGVPVPGPSAYANVKVTPYISNMSAMGQGAYGVSPPDFALDREPVYARAFATVALGVLPTTDRLLYYHTMVELPASTLTQSIFRENVNMDGILFYADTTAHQAVPSSRMYENAEGLIDGSVIREGLSRPELKAWVQDELKKVVRTQFDWSRNYADYGALRARILEKL